MSLPSPTAPPPLPDAPLPTLGTLSSRWQPPADAERAITTHTGAPLPPNLVYLGSPPEEIGAVRTAYSNITSEKGIDGQVGKRLGGAGGGFALGVVLVLYVGFRGGTSWMPGGLIPWCIIAGVIGAIIGYIASKPKYETNYVGEQGVASYQYGDKNQHIKSAGIFPFERGAALNVAQTNRHYRGTYQGTDYAFVWKDAAGKPVHTVKGSHKSKEGLPPGEHHFYFAAAAERAWSLYLLPELRARAWHGQSVTFPITGKGALTVSRDGINIHIGGKDEFVPRNNIGNLAIKAGQVTIARKDFKAGVLGFGKDGIYSFPYASLSNARLFLALVAEVVEQDAPQVDAVRSVAA